MTQTSFLTNLILTDLTSRGHLAWRNSTMGTFDRARGRYRTAHKSAIGTADIVCCLNGGQYLEIEIKTGDDKQSSDQQRHEVKVKQSGGKYFIVKDFNDYRGLRQSGGW